MEKQVQEISPKTSLGNIPGNNQQISRALTLLAASPGGMAEGLLLAHGISIEEMVALVQAGLATARGERTRAGDRQVEVAIVTITPAGREAIR